MNAIFNIILNVLENIINNYFFKLVRKTIVNNFFL